MIANCPKCKSDERVKNGHISGRQRYRCKNCKYDYTVVQKSTAVSVEHKRLALEMYLEGLGFNSISRILKVSPVAVMKWIRKYGKQAEELRSDNEIEVMEMDEMHSYIGEKKTTFGYGLLLTGTEKGSSILFWESGTEPHVKGFGQK